MDAVQVDVLVAAGLVVEQAALHQDLRGGVVDLQQVVVPAVMKDAVPQGDPAHAAVPATVHVHHERAGPGPHQHDHPVGVFCANIVEQMILPTGQLRKTIHRLLHDGRQRIVERVCRLARLKEHVGILGRTPQHRPIRVHGALAMIPHQIVVDHFADVVLGELLDLVHFVGRAEPIEEMQERHPRFEGGGVGDHRQIVNFLDRIRSQHGPSRLPDGHHVTVISEN